MRDDGFETLGLIFIIVLAIAVAGAALISMGIVG